MWVSSVFLKMAGNGVVVVFVVAKHSEGHPICAPTPVHVRVQVQCVGREAATLRLRRVGMGYFFSII